MTKLNISAFNNAIALVCCVLCTLPLLSHAKTSQTITYQYYDITGSTAKELLASMHENGPLYNDKRALGMAQASYSFNGTMRNYKGKCRFNALEVSVSAVVTLPKWTTPQNSPSNVRAAANNTFSIIKNHELGHVQIYMDTATKIENMLLRMPAEKSCNTLNDKAKTIAQRIWDEEETLQTQFHERSNGEFERNPHPTLMSIEDKKTDDEQTAKQVKKITEQTYPVRGNSGQQLLQSLKRNAPQTESGKPHYGHTSPSYGFSWKYGGINSNTEPKCVIKKVFPWHDITITLPHWVDYDKAPRRLKKLWDRIESDLKKHEQGHKTIHLKIMSRIEKQLLSLPAQTTCEQLATQAKKIINDMPQLTEKLHNAYDEKTNDNLKKNLKKLERL